MTTTLQQANDVLRSAVRARLDATPPEPRRLHRSTEESQTEMYVDWEPGFVNPTPAEQTLRQAVAAVRDRHTKYGAPTEHFARTAALVNAAFGTTFTAADWALVMVLDKIARQRGPAATDDAAIDIAGYAACHQECRRP